MTHPSHTDTLRKSGQNASGVIPLRFRRGGVRAATPTERTAAGPATPDGPAGIGGNLPSLQQIRDSLPPETPGYLLPVVEALLSGRTDEAASRRLGISPRTFSRRVAELLEHLNAATRFQGGAELARRGCRGCVCGHAGRPTW